jgi:formylglycine-generating enzyme required for sulfatase activity
MNIRSSASNRLVRRMLTTAVCACSVGSAKADFLSYSIVRTESAGYSRYELLGNFDGATDTVLNAFHIALVSGSTTYYHADALNGGVLSSATGTWNPQFVLVPGTFDSYVCIGGGEGFASGNSTAADPDWGGAGFNSAQIPYGDGTFGPGWFNQNPPNLQGRVNANGQVKLGQFVAPSGGAAEVFLKVGFNNGQGGGVEFGQAAFQLIGDCNGDGISDDIQIENGELNDCDGDGVPDECFTSSAFAASQSSAFSSSSPIEFVFTNLAPAYVGTPRIEIQANADLGAPTDALVVQLDGGPGATLFLLDGTDCAGNFAAIEQALPHFNGLIADGELRVRVSGFGVVDTANCPGGGLTVQLSYSELDPDLDCNRNGILDKCELVNGTVADCDGNGVPDSCELSSGSASDCNENGTLDACDLASGDSADLDGDGVPDECNRDCDGDGVLDELELVESRDADCDGNGRIDWCDIVDGALDKNLNGRLDGCEVAYGDFNLDGLINGGDLAPLLSLWGMQNPPIGDLDGDGVIGGADLSLLLDRWGRIRWQPTLSRIAPRTAPANGGTFALLEGASLGSVTDIRFGAAVATIVEIIDDTAVRVVVPSHPQGSVAVQVTTSDGIVSIPDLFQFGPANSATPSWATLIEAIPDPIVVYDPAIRGAIAATGWSWKVADAATGIEMLLIPPGVYDMGCSASIGFGCAAAEGPVHAVEITEPFYMSRTEVTQVQWAAVMGFNPSFHQGAADAANRPVERVSFEDVRAFLQLTALRLPTEAEWEYACRAESMTAFHGWAAQPDGTNADGLVGQIAWYTGNALGQSRAVGGKSPNGYGLHDMSGNVWEWVSDWYSGTYYASSATQDPQGPSTGTARVLRGGSWNDNTFNLRSSNRFAIPPGSARSDVGFRVVRLPL